METAGLIAFWFFLVWGLLGIFINKFPSCFFVLIGTLSARFIGKIEFPIWVVIVIALMWVIAYILNKKVLPNLIAKLHAYSKGATWGCTVGSILSLAISYVVATSSDSPTSVIPVFVVTILALPYLFAFLFEFIKVKNAKAAAAGGGAAFTLFLASSLVKFAAIYLAFYAVTELAKG